ncbi:AraC family transcriptional regulator [Mucilaginibacter sp. PPCGB 2223]|nr:AraC family transcriptional regulator [Mucilaginibacter sp. PPCGB 2223]
MLQSYPIYDICSLAPGKQDDVLVSRFAPYLEEHKSMVFPHRHSFYHLVLFTKGAGTHTIDFETFTVKPFQVYFMIPGQVHSWDFEGFADGYIINFSTSFFQSFLLRPEYLDSFLFFSGDLKSAVIDLPEDVHQQVTDVFELIIKEAALTQAMATDMLRTLMLQLFINISRVQGVIEIKGAASYNYTLLKSFQKLIEQHYTELKHPKDYAQLLYITPNHLNALCKDLLGMQAGEVIRNRVLLEAKRMLTNPQLSIADVALQLNFSDNSYFTKFFKKLTGTTPEEFRKNTLKST